MTNASVAPESPPGFVVRTEAQRRRGITAIGWSAASAPAGCITLRALLPQLDAAGCNGSGATSRKKEAIASKPCCAEQLHVTYMAHLMLEYHIPGRRLATA